MGARSAARSRSLETLQQLLMNVARDSVRAIEYYTNDRVRPGGEALPIRLLSDMRFPEGTEFSYIASARAHLNSSDDPRAIRTIVLHPYGWAEDMRRLQSTRAIDRRVRTPPTDNRRRRGSTPTSRVEDGLIALVEDPTYVIPAYARGANRSCDAKTMSVIQGMTNPQRGPAFHVVITRKGAVYVSASLDDRLSSTDVEAARDTVVDIAYEALLTVNRRDLEAAVTSATTSALNLQELPMSTPQINSLAVVFGKLFAAYPSFSRVIVDNPTQPGIYVQWGLAAMVQGGNFTNQQWVTSSSFNFATSDLPEFLDIVTRLGAFDLTTEVFRPYTPNLPTTARAQARTLISNIDTLGARSDAMGAYASLAAPDRSYEMQATARQEFYVQRAVAATGTADQAVEGAGTLAAVDTATPPSITVDEQSARPHVYDFTTGLWCDNDEAY